MQWADIGGKRRLLVGGKVNKFIPNPTFDPIAAARQPRGLLPGSQHRAASTSRRCSASSTRSSEHPAYRDRDARVRQLDEQGLDGALLFPTLGVGMQEALRRDLPALHAAFSAFNRGSTTTGASTAATAGSTPPR